METDPNSAQTADTRGRSEWMAARRSSAAHCTDFGADYHRMSAAGVFDTGRRVELVRGAIVDMAPDGTPHLWTVNGLTKLFAPIVAADLATLSVQNPIRLDEKSEPEPDIALLRPEADLKACPGPAGLG